jgi:CDP-diglyceride synthetase
MLIAVYRKALAWAKPIALTEAFLLSGAALAALFPMIVGAYFVKSALGINLLPGPSPLHDLLYHLIV